MELALADPGGSFIFMQFPAKILPYNTFLPQTQLFGARSSGKSWIRL